jgi:hypothetical protein
MINHLCSVIPGLIRDPGFRDAKSVLRQAAGRYTREREYMKSTWSIIMSARRRCASNPIIIFHSELIPFLKNVFPYGVISSHDRSVSGRKSETWQSGLSSARITTPSQTRARNDKGRSFLMMVYLNPESSPKWHHKQREYSMTFQTDSCFVFLTFNIMQYFICYVNIQNLMLHNCSTWNNFSEIININS